ncbi:hypothetical protein DMA12_09010 [Amycolatopsis balhimycina DSM 5908]|uniref:Butirosin biosynthesis protein H N-terminal domain-containing protein n=1 Tax=Amycolatopsis balhimycina DSM 5908 TaxID=1081091 RepID=A0A428WW87_AMYBA|nr:hypothetical protein [Amycolatopsis balhimycina]RSM47354.1 hypothetical protein DMA12_09010 [Amycolatopsis balhimycina DSM 5908]
MHLINAPDVVPELSCYTTNLVAYLETDEPGAKTRFAHAVRLAVLDGGSADLVFSQHTRIDGGTAHDPLGYRGAANWTTAAAGLDAELARSGRVLTVADTFHLPWSPAHETAHSPHWLLLLDRRDEQWLVADHFSALTPLGAQEPFLGWLNEAALERALTPHAPWPAEIANRDRHALGAAVEPVHAEEFRWLARTTGEVPATPGDWICGLPEVLGRVSDVLAEDETAAARYGDDLWAASRHYTYRLGVLAANGEICAEDAAAAAVCWGELPKVVRFAAESAARGRPRAGLLKRTFDDLLHASEKTTTEEA